jgi:hypothetical protein
MLSEFQWSRSELGIGCVKHPDPHSSEEESPGEIEFRGYRSFQASFSKSSFLSMSSEVGKAEYYRRMAI